MFVWQFAFTSILVFHEVYWYWCADTEVTQISLIANAKNCMRVDPFTEVDSLNCIPSLLIKKLISMRMLYFDRYFLPQQETLQNYKLATANVIIPTDIMGLDLAETSPQITPHNGNSYFDHNLCSFISNLC